MFCSPLGRTLITLNHHPLLRLQELSHNHNQRLTLIQVRTISAAAADGEKWDARYSHPVPHTNEYYFKCMLGGVLSCGLTHTLVVPLDVVKCNMQVCSLCV